MLEPKEAARRIINNLPDNTTWEEIMYQFYINIKVANRIKDVDNQKLVDHEEVKKRILGGLKKE